jgi:pimeloyl-ACP methyl ester carboxylesterase
VKRAETSGGALAYHDEGSGPAVVLLHGYPLTSYIWRGLIPALASRHRVIAPDLLGLGASEKPASAALDIRAQAGYVGELLSQLGIDRVALIGHSTGGGIAQLLVDAREDVEALVLIDTIAFDRWPTEAVGEIQVLPADGETHESAELVVRSALRLGTVDDRLADEDVRAYLAPWAPPSPVDGLFRFARSLDGRGLKQLEDAMASWDLPTLILWGEDDPFHPVDVAERLNAAIASSALGLVPESGHFLPDEAPETIFPIIAEYLRANYLRIPHAAHAAGPVLVPLGAMPRDVAEEDDREPVVADDQEVGPNA